MKILERAKQLHRCGKLAEAKRCYQRYLEARPGDPAALHLLGFAEFQSFQFDRAIELIKSAVRLRPTDAEFHNNLALAYLAARQFDAAEQHALEAKRLGHVDGHGYWHVGIDATRRRDWDHAECAIRLGLSVQPSSAEAYNCLGIVYAAQQRHTDAEACYRRALVLRVDYAEALNNLGNLLRDQHRAEEGIPCYRRALELAPSFAAAHNNLGVAWAIEGKLDEAVICYERALRHQPDYAEAVNNLGNAHRDLGDNDAAVDCYRRALMLQAGSAEIQSNLGVALRRGGRVTDAVAYFRRAIVLQPQSTTIHHHLAMALGELGQSDAAAACLWHMARLAPEQPLWRLHAAQMAPTVFASRAEMDVYWKSIEREVTAVSNSGFPLDFTQCADIAPAPSFGLQFYERNLRELKERYAAVFHSQLDAAYRSSWVTSWRGPARQPRVGIVVTEGHEGIFLKSLQGVLERLSGFELMIFCCRRYATRLRAVARQDLHVIHLPTRFDRIARTIDEAHCDLLYYWEIGTDSLNYFLAFHRLAPIQLTSWGIQVTSGIPNIDYYLSSGLVEPPDAGAHYSERLMLADTLLTYRERVTSDQPLQRDTFGLPSSARWYVCAQQFGKFHIDFDELLAGILRQDPEGIVVAAGEKQHASVVRLQQRLRQTIPDVAHRIHLLSRLEAPQYFSLLHHADVILDPPHFGGVNSTYDSLSLGKAIVVLPSGFHRGRYTLGCYRKMQVDDCVALSRDDYVARAVRLANDGTYRSQVEKRIVDGTNRLFSDLSAVREHERLFHELLRASDVVFNPQPKARTSRFVALNPKQSSPSAAG